MARRQGGVHFTYLVVAIVMCVGAIFWVVAINGKLEEVRGQLVRAQGQVAEKEGRIGDLSTKYDAMRELTVGSVDIEPDVASLRALLERAGRDVGNATGGSSLTYDSFQALYQDSVQALSNLKSQLDSQKAAAQAKDSEAIAAVNERDTIVASKDEEIASLRDNVNEGQITLERVRTEARDEAGRLQEEIDTTTEEWSSRVYKLERDLAINKGLLDQSNKRIEILQREINKEKTFAIVEPDGKVLRVEEELGFAWIDLGKDDRLRRGLIFDVFQYVKGGKRLAKGRVEVARIEADFAEVKVLETYDRFNPIAAGDRVASPFYSGEDRPVFVFAGEKPINRRLSQEQMSRKIEAFGGTVEAAVRLETDYVIAIQGYEDTPEYQEARKLGITILREDELLDFIEY